MRVRASAQEREAVGMIAVDRAEMDDADLPLFSSHPAVCRSAAVRSLLESNEGTEIACGILEGWTGYL